MLTLPAGALVLTLAASPGGLPGNLSLGLPPLRLGAATADEAPALDFIEVEDEARNEPGPLRERSDFGVRVLAETGGIVMLGTGGAIAGFAAGVAACHVGGAPAEDGFGCLGPGIIGGVAGLWVGTAAGTTLGGHLTGADGSFFAALLGSLVGGIAGGYLTERADLAVAFGSIGSITAYELSVSSERVKE